LAIDGVSETVDGERLVDAQRMVIAGESDLKSQLQHWSAEGFAPLRRGLSWPRAGPPDLAHFFHNLHYARDEWRRRWRAQFSDRAQVARGGLPNPAALVSPDANLLLSFFQAGGGAARPRSQSCALANETLSIAHAIPGPFRAPSSSLYLHYQYVI